MILNLLMELLKTSGFQTSTSLNLRITVSGVEL